MDCGSCSLVLPRPLWNGQIPFIVDGEDIGQLADSLIPSHIYSLSRYQMLLTYSPAEYIYLEAQNRLNEDGEMFHQMIRAEKFWNCGKVMSPWKVNIEPHSFTGTHLTQKQLKALYEYYINPKLNVPSSRTYTFSTVVTYMKRGWGLQAAKYF